MFERLSGRFYQGVGDVSVAYDFGRSWQIRGACQRGVQYLAVLRDPVVTSGFSTAVDGLLSGRVLFTASAGYSTGVSAFNLNSSTAFTTYTGVVRVSRAATRTLSGVRRVPLLLLRLSRVSPTPAWPSSTTAEERRTRRAHVVVARDRQVTVLPGQKYHARRRARRFSSAGGGLSFRRSQSGSRSASWSSGSSL